MHLKDYYTILEAEPSATVAEIKKAYRRLALQYHPDKTNNDPYASARFTDIKEAYEVLTDPSKKEYYLQQRWYNQSIGKRKTQDPVTPVTVLQQALELERHVAALDVFRMDKEGLRNYILELLNSSTIEKLQGFNEPAINGEIISAILKSMNPLPAFYTGEITERLKILAGKGNQAQQQIDLFISKTSKRHKRQRYSLLIMVAVTFLLCLLIYLAGR